ncbi:MAG: RNA-protein complex protein Nop10 [Candidatus Nanoarchaeia archaeon]
MNREILKCPKCNTYTMKENCPLCGEKTLSPKPARFSLEDKWGKWRRQAKKEQGLI